eukprot:evm.model.scf_1127.2 EVM.evm.TU.scf_1127.2   scf_1127:18716-23506(-)
MPFRPCPKAAEASAGGPASAVIKVLRDVLSRMADARDVGAARWVSAALLLWEATLCTVIIWKVPYTEIDWVAYMQQVEIFLEGERDYLKLEGQTGPCVYPAGHVYTFAFLRWLTNEGSIFRAQVIFAAIYLVTLALVLQIYVRSQAVPPWALVLLCLSKRLHSIFILRMFNDCVAMMIAYLALLLLMENRPRWSILAFSAAVSVKMNVLLMAPPVLVVMMQAHSMATVAQGAGLGLLLQLFLAAPFLQVAPASYLSRAFELSRVFMYKWTVNLKFLPESVFLSKQLAVGLLVTHLAVLLIFAHSKFTQGSGGLAETTLTFCKTSYDGSQEGTRKRSHGARLTPCHIAWTVMTGNFVGVVCARSLHYQFYSWYFHSVPLLLWHTPLPVPFRVALWAAVEICWNVFPSTPASSLVLLACHLALLAGLWLHPVPEFAKRVKRL